MSAVNTHASIEVRTRSAAETRGLAAALAVVARAGDRIALIGPLGAGKTQFAKGFAAGLGVTEVVNSPSFTLMAEYAGRLPLFHQDLYRLAGAEEVIGGGLADERRAQGVTLSEWAERMPDAIEPGRLAIRFTVTDGDERLVVIATAGPEQQRYVETAADWARQADG